MPNPKVFEGTASTTEAEILVDTTHNTTGAAPYLIEVANYDSTHYLLVSVGQGSQDFVALQPGNTVMSIRRFYSNSRYVNVKTEAGTAVYQITCHY